MSSWGCGKYLQCRCIVHKQLTEERGTEYKRRLRQLLRTPLYSDTGILFAQAVLELILAHLGKKNFVVQKSGSLDGVNYVLWVDYQEHNFRGFPDFSVHFESDTIANRILVVMGEVQSTRDAAMQNAIYAVGNLSKTPRKELLVLTFFKNKSATTSIAHLKVRSPSSTPAPTEEAWGVVTLKYYISPHQMDLTQVKGVQDLAYRLNLYTNAAII